MTSPASSSARSSFSPPRVNVLRSMSSVVRGPRRALELCSRARNGLKPWVRRNRFGALRRRRSVPQGTTMRCPLGAAIPVFKPIRAPGAHDGALVAPLDRPQSLCSSQIRPRMTRFPFLGTTISRAGFFRMTRAALGGPTGFASSRGRGLDRTVARGGLRTNHGSFPALPARKPCVQADLAAGPRVTVPYPCPRRGRKPCAQARSGPEGGTSFLATEATGYPLVARLVWPLGGADGARPRVGEHLGSQQRPSHRRTVALSGVPFPFGGHDW